MSVVAEAASVIVKKSAIEEKMAGGFDEFIGLVPNSTFCQDDYLVRVGFMSVTESEKFIELLTTHGLSFLENGVTVDIALIQQGFGFSFPCDWAEYFNVYLFKFELTVQACRMIGDESEMLGTPHDWKPSKLTYASPEDLKTRYVYMRTEGNIDVFFDIAEQKVVYRGRTDLE